MRRILGVCLVALATSAVGSSASALPASPISDPTRVHEQLIVTWKQGSTGTQRAAALASAGAQAQTRLSGTATLPGGTPAPELVDMGAPSLARSAKASLAANPAVASVERNARIRAAGKPALPSEFNDPLLTDTSCGFSQCSQWGLLGNTFTPRALFGTDAVSAWAHGARGSSNVYVGVVDEGVDISHEDLAGNIFTNPNDPPDGIDNDHNGYVDDTHGWDFFHNDNTVFDGKEQFDFIDAHGTIVAGEIGARGGNGTGGSGVAWNIGLIPAKFIGPEFGTTAGAIAAINYVTDLKLRDHVNVVATNNSWAFNFEEEEAGEKEELPALQAAIQRAADANILFITVAGNGDSRGVGYNIDERPLPPASLECHLSSGADCMITATAITRSGAKPRFANWGSKTVDIGAPGYFIWSTFPFNGYEAYSGTSQAAPFVTGAAALYAARYPAASPTQIREAILSTAKRTRSLEGRVATNGRLQIAAALKHPPE